MSDDADHAQRLEEWERQHRLGAVVHPPAEPPRRRESPDCEACGDEIEAERLAVQPGARRCVECQAAFERTRRVFCS